MKRNLLLPVVLALSTPLFGQDLTEVEHRLTAEAVGTNPAAKPRSMFGLDYVKLEALKITRPLVSQPRSTCDTESGPAPLQNGPKILSSFRRGGFAPIPRYGSMPCSVVESRMPLTC